MKAPLLCCALFFFLQPSCTPELEAPPAVSRSSAAITNGADDRGDPAVVAIGQAGAPPSCTGVLVAPRVVLTAAHCVDASADADLPRVFFASAARTGDGFVATLYARVHPAYQAVDRSNDIAALLLATTAPWPVSPVPLNTRPFDRSFIGLPVRLVGYGSLGAAPPNAGVKREGVATLTEYTESKFTFHASPSQTCSGDSGGPAFVSLDGKEYLGGISSSGDPGCNQFARSMRVDVYVADFIRPFIEATGVAAAHFGERCHYAENCASGLCAAAEDDWRIQYCSVRCASDADCPRPTRCRTGAGGVVLCRFAVPTPGAAGAPCTTDADCGAGLCARPASDAVRVCSVRCFPENQSACAAEDACLPNPDAPRRYSCFRRVAETLAAQGGCAYGQAASSSWPGGVTVLLLCARAFRRRKNVQDARSRW